MICDAPATAVKAQKLPLISGKLSVVRLCRNQT